MAFRNYRVHGARDFKAYGTQLVQEGDRGLTPTRIVVRARTQEEADRKARTQIRLLGVPMWWKAIKETPDA